MVYGWAGTILRIDLTKNKISKIPSSEYTRLFLGGRGVNAKLMFDESKPGVSAFDPENPIILGAGALAGTGITAAATLEITSRSPEQHPEGFGELNIGGHWATELKFAGYDNVVIKGRAKKPTYIYIENEDVQFRDAAGVWGKGTFDTERIIREELGDPRVQILAIGPAGEKLVRLATIEHERRSGTALGAVFGAKNLKAVVVRGTKSVRVYDPQAILDINEERLESLKKLLKEDYGEYAIGAEANRYCFETRDVGTVGYFDGFEWPELGKVDGAPYVKKHVVRRMGCYSCPIADVAVLSVPGVGIGVMRCYPFFWPRLVRLTDMDAAFKITMLCSDYGLDNRNLLTAISWLMSLYDKGIITAKDTDGIPMEWGSADAIIKTIHKVANREGFGDILADGVLNLAKKLGPKAKAHLMHRRGMMPGSEEYRCDVGGALAAAVDSTASADHTVREMGFGTLWERHLRKLGKDKEIEEAYARSKEIYGTEKAIIPWEYEGKAQIEVAEENVSILMDSLGVCYFAEPALDPSLFQRYLLGAPIPVVTPMTLACFKAAFGLDVDEKFLLTIAEKIINVEKAYNMREGFTRKDDTAYERLFKEPIPDGPRKGMKLDKAKFEKMKDEYYKLRGWDVETGNPTRETFAKLGLKDVADSLDKLGRLPKKKAT